MYYKVIFSSAQALFDTQVNTTQSIYGQTDASLRVIRSIGQNYVMLRVIKSSIEEYQTRH